MACRVDYPPIIIRSTLQYRGLGSSVSIANDYGLEGPGSNPGGD